MAHHSRDMDPEMSEHFKQMFAPDRNEALEQLHKKLNELERLGATGRFPEGKLTEKDEGEIKMAVFNKDGNVVIDFGHEVVWVGMTPRQAVDFGNLLIKHGRESAGI